MYACIDLGSNSFHLLIAEWQDGKSQIVERFSHIVQLGEGVALSGEISPAAFKRGLDSLQEFVDVMSRYPITQYWALGTNALRLSRNASQSSLAGKTNALSPAVLRLAVSAGETSILLLQRIRHPSSSAG
jgi:exopolyphosphatase/pppGpp-phosphohydrolase